jgi:hypothetical protein
MRQAVKSCAKPQVPALTLPILSCPRSASDLKRVLTTGSFRVLQCNSSQKPFVAFSYVPNAVVRDLNLNEWFVRGELRSLGTGHRPRYIVTISVTAYLALLFIAAMQASSVNLPK